MRFLRPCVAVVAVMLAAAPPVSRADDKKPASPAFVVRLKSIEGLLSDFKYIGGLVGQEEALKQAEPLLDNLKSIDFKRPILMYADINPDNPQDSPAVLMIPIADDKAFLETLANFNIKPEKGKDGIYTLDNLPVPVPVTLYFRFANKYCCITAQNKDNIADKNLLKPEAISDAAGDDSLLAVKFRMSAIPDNLKQLALLGMDNQLANAKEQKVENETPAMKELRMKMIDFMGARMKSVLTDGDEVAVRLGVDQKADDITADISFSAKKGSQLAKEMESVGKGRSLFAGLPSDNAAIRFAAAIALPEEMRKMLGPVVDDAVKEALKKETDAQKAKLAKAALDALSPTLKSGEFDAGLSLVGPNKDGQYTFVGGAKVVKGKGIDSALREIHAAIPEKDKGKIILDATTVGDLKVHKLVAEEMDENSKKMLGSNAIYLAIRDDAVLVAGGVDGLKALKEAAAAQAVSSNTLVNLNVSVGRAAALDPKNAKAAKTAQEVFGKNPKGNDTVAVTVEMAEKLRVKVTAKGKILTFGAKQQGGE